MSYVCLVRKHKTCKNQLRILMSEEEVCSDTMPEDIVNAFYAGEVPLCMMENLSEQQSASSVRKKLLSVSNQRLLYFEENATGLYDVTTFAFARIDSAVSHEGKKAAELKVEDTDGVTLKIGWLLNEEAQKILLTLQSAMNEIGTATVSLEKKKPMFSGEEWILKKPVDYLTKTFRCEGAPMTETFIAPILEEETVVVVIEEEDEPLFEDAPEETVIASAMPPMDQETILECLKAVKLLYEKGIISEELYKNLRLPLLEKLDL